MVCEVVLIYRVNIQLSFEIKEVEVHQDIDTICLPPSRRQQSPPNNTSAPTMPDKRQVVQSPGPAAFMCFDRDADMETQRSAPMSFSTVDSDINLDIKTLLRLTFAHIYDRPRGHVNHVPFAFRKY